MRDRGTPKTRSRILDVVQSKPWRIPMVTAAKPRGGFSTRALVYGFAGIIALGTLLLMLPVSSRTQEFTSPVNALFTATSATCVTGLVVLDTGTYWSFFGQVVILILIQTGGFGFMTGATAILSVLGRRIRLRDRLLVSESLSLEGPGGMVRIVRRMALFTALAEGIGAVIFFLCFVGENPPLTALWRAIFHTISAFNNAGFSIFGNFQSLLTFQRDAVVLLVTAFLIILGGISFAVVMDIYTVRRWDRLSLNSKIVLSTTAVLLGGGMLVILLAEYRNPATMGALSFPWKLLNAFFHAVTPRTAGFNSLDLTVMLDHTLFFTMLLMFIGGATGSTAGGIKVNTIGVLSATILSSLKGRENAGAFGREFRTQLIYRALALAIISLGLVAVWVFLLSMTESFTFLSLIFETVSAFATVGLSSGITLGLSLAGRLLMIILMFVGRLGPLTLVLSLRQRQQPSLYRYPGGTISIG
ncbi:MAG: TrkH family potassium uptake protein [Chloroflexota bacterium]